MLAEDVTLYADGGGKARGAATQPEHGREDVARFLLASTRLLGEHYVIEITLVNGEPAVIARVNSCALVVLLVSADQGRIQTIWAIDNPDKLTRL